MNSGGARILVVDDEPEISRSLQMLLNAHGFEARSALDGKSGLEVVRDWKPHLIITDLSMPKMSGIALCQAIRSKSDTPIIVLSVKQEETSKVQALECGADDYVTKPFGLNELLARVRAALRRSSTLAAGTETLEAGDFRIDLAAHRVEIGGREIHLTPKEFELLTVLMRSAGKLLTHNNLLLAIWGEVYVNQTDTIRVLVRQLRRKIEPNPAVPKYLKTEPWIGYRFDPTN
jgi:two-component system KDP operon response regulator KdpE